MRKASGGGGWFAARRGSEFEFQPKIPLEVQRRVEFRSVGLIRETAVGRGRRNKGRKWSGRRAPRNASVSQPVSLVPAFSFRRHPARPPHGTVWLEYLLNIKHPWSPEMDAGYTEPRPNFRSFLSSRRREERPEIRSG